MRRARIAVQARVDMLEIWHYIAQSSLQNAGKVWLEFKAAIDLLAQSPGLGHIRAEVKEPSLRFWSVHSYLITYRTFDNGIEVVRVVSGHRDLKRLFPRPKR